MTSRHDEANERTFRPESAWKLDLPERAVWLPPEDVIDRLELVPGMCVADIGAGTGYFAIPIARRIAPGRLFAIDLQPEMLEKLRARLEAEPVENIELREGSATATTLDEECCDVVFLANLWHELDDTRATLAEAERVLRGGGRIAILDWRKDVTRPPGPPLEHRIAMTRTVEILKSSAWRVDRVTLVGTYSYLVLAGK